MASALPFLMFLVLVVLIMSGYPVAFTLAGTAIFFSLIAYGLDIFYLSDFAFIPPRIYGIMSNPTLMAVPLFIFMGSMLEKSRIAEELLGSMERVFGSIRGGLAISVILVGTLLAAATGICGATVVTMGVLSLPTMLRRGYNKELATGTIVASGTLGQIIPPSIVLVLLGSILNVDVGDLFIGAIIPGFLLVFLYIIYIALRSFLQPHLTPLSSKEELKQKISIQELCKSILVPVSLIIIVLGSIFVGLASPTEAAGCGALGVVLIVALKRSFNMSILKGALRETTSITSMVFMILVASQFFGLVFRGLNGDQIISDFIMNLSLSPGLVLFTVLFIIFILGFFLDFFEICFIVLPIVTPILIALEYDPLWLAIVFAVNIQTSFLTPPFGFALFYLKGVCPPEVSTLDLYRGVVPFILIQLLVLLLVVIFPETVIWLPKVFF